MKGLLIAAVVGIAALSAGCANQPKLDFREYAGEPVKSFYMHDLDGWSAVSKNQLVVWAESNKAYLIEVSGYCPDLQFVNTVAVTSTGSTVDKFEKVIVGRDRCLIKTIRPIDVKQMREDRKLMREQQKSAES